MKRSLIFTFALLILAIAAPVFAQSGELNVLCTPQELWCQGMEEAFEAKYPEIDVQWIRLSSGEGLARVQSEAGNPTFDIWWGGPMDTFIAAKPLGLLEQYESPNLKNIIPEYYDLFVDKDHYYTGIYMGSLGFITNTDWLAENPGVEAPTSFEDLLKPEFKGQIVISHPSTAGTAYTFLSTVLQVMGEEKGWEYLKKFNEQVAIYTKSGSGAGKYVANGEFAVAIMFSHDGVKEIEDNGAHLVITFPKEGTGYEVGAEAILKGAKNLENTKLWYDWALTPEAQSLGPKFQSYQAPTVTGVELSHPELLQVKLIDYDFQWSGAHKQEFQDKFANEIQNADMDESGVLIKQP
ncbi:MAG TPA: ABC transporter substrate-binding protein [Flexilinea sp.]|nr:ABC transporter substrate-binding protein [Flexilinea sp.]